MTPNVEICVHDKKILGTHQIMRVCRSVRLWKSANTTSMLGLMILNAGIGVHYKKIHGKPQIIV